MANDILQKALDELRHSARPPTDRYAEGYKAGYAQGVADLLAAIKTNHNASPAPSPTVAKPQQPTVNSPPNRLTAPNKDQLVRQFLTSNPGVRYRELNRELPPYVATRVYALEKRGEVRKDDDGRFYLVTAQ